MAGNSEVFWSRYRDKSVNYLVYFEGPIRGLLILDTFQMGHRCCVNGTNWSIKERQRADSNQLISSHRPCHISVPD